MNARQKAFVAAYIKTKSPEDAAIEAGYSKRSAYSTGSRMLDNAEIRNALDHHYAKLQTRTEISESWVVDRLVKITNRCMQEEPVLDKMGSPTGEYKFDSKGATGALKLIGEHIGMFNKQAEREPVAPVNFNRADGPSTAELIKLIITERAKNERRLDAIQITETKGVPILESPKAKEPIPGPVYPDIAGLGTVPDDDT